MVAGLAAKGYDREFAERCFRQIEGFGEYGFPESHAASFALLVYASCWMKCRYPDVFLAAMLNAQPLGFYAPSQLVRDAREHGVEVREVDVNFSDWDARWRRKPLPRQAGEADCTAATPRWLGDIRAAHAVRLGLRQILGAREEEMRKLVERARRRLRFRARSLAARRPFARRARKARRRRRVPLARARPARGALGGAARSNRVGDQDDLPLFAAARPERDAEPDAKLPPMPLGAHVVEDYRRLSLSLKAHPVAFMRARLAARGILRSDALDRIEERRARDGRRASCWCASARAPPRASSS